MYFIFKPITKLVKRVKACGLDHTTFPGGSGSCDWVNPDLNTQSSALRSVEKSLFIYIADTLSRKVKGLVGKASIDKTYIQAHLGQPY